MTELLLKLLGAGVDDAVRIADGSLALRGGVSPGWILCWIVLLGVGVSWMYRHSPVTLSPARRHLLTGLRVLFLALLLALLLRPVIAFTVEGSVRRLLVLLLDGSASMQIKDPRLEAADQKRAAIGKGLLDPAKGLNQTLDRSRLAEAEHVSRLDLLKDVLRNEKLNLLTALDKEFDLAVFTFGQSVVELSSRNDRSAGTNSPSSPDSRKTDANEPQFSWVETLQAASPGTAIGDAAREVMNRKRGQPLAGILLATDGANNSGSQPREMAGLLRQEGLPLYVYGVGITSPRDLIVANLFAPEVTFVKDEMTVTVRVRAQGISGQNAELVLKLGQKTVAAKTLAFAGDGEQVVALRFTPETEGEFDLTAEIEPRADETISDNNSRTQRLKVIDAKIQVLLADQGPRWEFRYLQAMLLRDRRVELKCFLAEGDPAIARAPNSPYLAQFPARKEDLYQFDLVIYGDLDPKQIGAAHLENLNELVSKFGGALVLVAGKRFSPHAYRRTVLERMLPVEFDAASPETSGEVMAEKPVRLELTSAGRASAMLRLSDKEDENVALWKQLPPVYWAARVSRPKPAAEVLLADPDPAKESRFGRMPVVALQQYGLGQVMYVGTDNTWRWRRNVGDIYYTAFWGQIVQRVSLQRLLGVSKRIQLSTDRQNYMSGDRISIYARLYSAGYEPLQDPVVKGLHRRKDGQGPRTEVALRPLPEQTGLYRGEFVAPAAGVYQFFVEMDAETPLDFNVTEPKFELGETAMNEGLLKELAGVTEGAFFREEDLHKLPNTIRAKTERVRSPLEVELWSSPLYFILLLGVVTVEWVLRKLWHLK